MSSGYRPPDYGAKDKSKAKGNLRERILEPEKKRKSYEDRRKRAVEQHIKRSATKKLMDIFFGVAFLSLLLHLIFVVSGMAPKLGPLNHIPMLFMAPIRLVWHYETEPVFKAGNIQIPLAHIAMMVIYGILYPVLTAIHAVASENRTYIPE